MTWTYDLVTDIGRVRRTIPDRVQAEAIFTDEEIASFVDDEGDWRRATALALETVASDQALVLQVIKVGNLSTDGASVARALLGRAKSLREQASDADAADDDGGAFDIAEMAFSPFGTRDRLYKESLRDG